MVWVNNCLFMHISHDTQAKKKNQDKKIYPNQFQDTKQIKFQPTNKTKKKKKKEETEKKEKYTLRDECSCLTFYPDKN